MSDVLCNCRCNETTESKLIKPCPFCGETAALKNIGYLFNKDNVYVVTCPSCGGSTPYSDDIETAVEKWNKRSFKAAIVGSQNVYSKKIMTLTTALIILNDLNTTERIDVEREQLIEAVKVVSAAAKKQLSVPLTIKHGMATDSSGNEIPVKQPCCPICGEAILNARQRRIEFCPSCGQAIHTN